MSYRNIPLAKGGNMSYEVYLDGRKITLKPRDK